MATFVVADDYRVPGEKFSLFWGFAVLIFVLLCAGIVTAGIIPLLLIAFTAIAVWVAQSKLLDRLPRSGRGHCRHVQAGGWAGAL